MRRVLLALALTLATLWSGEKNCGEAPGGVEHHKIFMYDLTSEELTRNAQTLLFILKNIPQKERCYISPSLSIYFSVFYVPNTHFSIFICWMLIHLQSMGFLLKLVFLSSGSELEEDASSDQRASNQHEKYWLLALQISILISG